MVGLSGGIDSSVTVGLCQKALGKDRVVALLMPERHSSEDTLDLSRSVADHFGVQVIHEDITPVLEALGFYQRYDAAISSVIPGYGTGWKSKIVTSSILEKGFTFFSAVAQSPEGDIIKKRLDLKSYLAVVAATNFKQRTRKLLEYYHADRLNYAVAGTPNRLEYDQGFFVKTVMVPRILSQLPIYTNPRSISWPPFWGSQKRLSIVRPPRTRILCPRTRMNFIFPSPMKKWIFAFTEKITAFQLKPSARSQSLPLSRWSGCIKILTRNGQPQNICTCPRCWWKKYRRLI